MASVAQSGVLIKSYRGFGAALLISWFGSKLYEETNLYAVAKKIEHLGELYPLNVFPVELNNPVLRILANVMWQCSSAAEICIAINPATAIQANSAVVANSIEIMGDLLEKYPTAIFNVDQLPVSKRSLKACISTEWNKATNDERKSLLEIAYIYLAQFQENLGSDMITSPQDNMPTSDPTALQSWMSSEEGKRHRVKFESWLEIQKRCTGEMKLLTSDIEEWKRKLKQVANT